MNYFDYVVLIKIEKNLPHSDHRKHSWAASNLLFYTKTVDPGLKLYELMLAPIW